jgi:uncharacterized protein (TIGR02246 family)
VTSPAQAAEVTEPELMQAASSLARQYDANYAAKNPAGMAALYAPDGVLVAPSGSVVRGRQALTTYYANRFASGASGHQRHIEALARARCDLESVHFATLSQQFARPPLRLLLGFAIVQLACHSHLNGEPACLRRGCCSKVGPLLRLGRRTRTSPRHRR